MHRRPKVGGRAPPAANDCAHHVSGDRHVIRSAGDWLRLRRVPVRRSARPALATIRFSSSWLTARRSWWTRPLTCEPRRSGSAYAESMRFSSPTATPTTSWASTTCGASTSCSERPFRATAMPARSPTFGRMFAYVFEPADQPGGGLPAAGDVHLGGPFSLGHATVPFRSRSGTARDRFLDFVWVRSPI